MPKEFYRRSESYEEALKNEDRPVWHENKARRMTTHFKEGAEPYSDLEDIVSGILNKHDINGPLRSVYHSFAKKAFKMYSKGTASPKALDYLADFWIKTYKAERRVLNEILGIIKKSPVRAGGRR